MIEIPTPDKLLPCPFCGCEAYYTRAVNGSEMHYVGCSECGISFKAQEIHYSDQNMDRLTKDIVAFWNRRSPYEQLRKAFGGAVAILRNDAFVPGNPEKEATRMRWCDELIAESGVARQSLEEGASRE